jgi:hypothetical protein
MQYLLRSSLDIVIFVTTATSSRVKDHRRRWHTCRTTLILILQNKKFLLRSSMLIMLMSRSNILGHSFTEIAGKMLAYDDIFIKCRCDGSREPDIDVEHPDGRSAVFDL